MNLDKMKSRDKKILKHCDKVLSRYSDLQLIMFALTTIVPHGYNESFDDAALWTELFRRLPE